MSAIVRATFIETKFNTVSRSWFANAKFSSGSREKDEIQIRFSTKIKGEV